MSLVPANLPIRVGAALCARSEPAFRKHVLPLVADAGGNVNRLKLEAHLMREISASDYLAALTRLEPRRARERAYRRTA